MTARRSLLGVKTNMKLKNLSRALFVAVSLLFAGGAIVPSMSQEIAPEQLALARKYVDVTDSAGVFEVTLAQMAYKTFKLFAGTNPKIETEIKDAITRTIDAMKPKKDELMNQFAMVYATDFTAEELQQIIDFYDSPVGKKLSADAVKNNQAIQAVMGVFTNNLGTEFVSKTRADLKAKGFDI